MRLFIAEKPSIAKAIAAELGITKKGNGYIECGEDTITWCFGHMFQQAEPDEYTPDDVPTSSTGSKIWRTEELPIIPKQWISHPKPETEQQLNIIGKLINKATLTVNAGDPDREGQLLVDAVLIHFCNKSPVKRYWANALHSEAVKGALDDLRDNQNYIGMAHAATGRARADWLIGMNLTRAYTLRAKRGGSLTLLTVGRVQTPTLAIVVQRDREIETFTPISYHTLKAQFSHTNGSFNATWKAHETQAGIDSEGRLTDTTIANSIVTKLKGERGKISEYKTIKKTQSQPKVFSLSDITLTASNKFGYNAEDVLKTCQSLYESKLTTYPRSDCPYLPEKQLNDAPAILAALKQTIPELIDLIDNADTSIKSNTWNDKKITAHHGIIPTLHTDDKTKFNDKERNIYELIVRSYLAQFYPSHEYLTTSITVELAGEIFTTKGKVVTLNGWKDIFQEDEDDKKEDGQPLPAMKKTEEICCDDINIKDNKTKPPSRFTEGALIKVMENVHKFVPDPVHKKMLKEGDGIGTPATRASILSELRRREYLVAKGKLVISTTLGRSMIDALPESVKSPALTALFERQLKKIEAGEADISTFTKAQEEFIRKQVSKAGDGAVSIAGAKKAPIISTTHFCPDCNVGLIRRPRKKGFWWGCSLYPDCDHRWADMKGKPNFNKSM